MTSSQMLVNRGPLLVNQATLTVGVLADTHLPFRLQRMPKQVMRALEGVDLIIHAGDVDDVDYLADLAKLAPLWAVRGNLHFTDLSHGGMDLPVDLQLQLAGYQVVVNHGGWPNFWSLGGDWFMDKIFDRERKHANPRLAGRLLKMYSSADVIVFGHTHRPCRLWQDGTLLLNPGAVCSRQRKPSVAKLVLKPGLIQAEIIRLNLSDSRGS